MDLSKKNKILIIRLSSLGDILLTTPLIRSLKLKFQNSEIDFLVRNEYLDAVRLNPDLNEIFIYSDNKDLIEKLNSNNYDLILDLQNNLRSAKITSSLKGKISKFKKRSFKKFLLVNFKINLLKNFKSIPERYSETVEDFQLDEKGPELFLPENIKANLNDDENIIGFAPGSRHFTKMYPENYFVDLGKKLSENGFKIAIFGGKSDKEICAEISKQIPNSVDLSNDNDLFQTAAGMKKCRVIICNDSGLMHTATSVNVPVIAIFGSTVKEFGFAPYKTRNLILENNLLSCRPCSHIGKEKCPKGHFKCMLEIKPEFVFEKTIQFLNVLKEI